MYTQPTEDKKADRKKLEKYSKVGYNVAEDLDDYNLGHIGDEVLRGFEIDDNSRSEKKDKWVQGQKLAQLTIEAKNTPFENASNVKYPLIITAAIQFNARSYPAIIRDGQVVKNKIHGEDPENQKQQQGDNAVKYMNWQLTEEMVEWDFDTDRLLLMLPLYGTMFRKTWFSSSKQRPCSRVLTPENLVVNTGIQDLETAPRISEMFCLYPNQVEEHIRAGIFIPFEYRENGEDTEAEIEFIEQHCNWDLDGDGYKEPYIVTVHKSTGSVARIVANFKLEDVEVNQKGQVSRIKKREYYTSYIFIPATDGSFYGIGFFDILYPINEVINTTLNQLLDAGKLANSNSGFIAKNLRIGKGPVRMKLGQLNPVNATGNDIRNGLVFVDFPGPSTVLFQLLGLIVEAGKEVANLKDVLTGDANSATMPVGTTLALIEQGMQVFSVIYTRVHRGIGRELKILKEINAEYLDPQQYVRVMDIQVSPDDFKDPELNFSPVSDPRMVTDMQRMGRAQFLMQFAGDPFFDPIEIRMRLLEAANIDSPEKLVIEPQQQQGPSMEEQLAMLQAQNEQTRLKIELRKLELEERKVQNDTIAKRAKAVSDLASAEAQEAGMQIDSYVAATERLAAQQQAAQPATQSTQPKPQPAPAVPQEPPPGPIQEMAGMMQDQSIGEV